MRVFVAIELNAFLCDTMSTAVQAMKNAKPPVKLKWARPGQQHLTLHFFGEVSPARVEDISGAVRRAAGSVEPFEMTPAELGCFPNIYKPNVLWAGIQEPSGALRRLHKALAGEIRALGFTHDQHAFTPHLTLARVPRESNSSARKVLGDWFVRQTPPAPVAQRVEQVHVMRSDLSAEGHRYTTLSAAPLAGEGVPGLQDAASG